MADAYEVNVFQRFALMQAWHDIEWISFNIQVDADDWDRLHHSEYSAHRVAVALRGFIRAAADNDRV